MHSLPIRPLQTQLSNQSPTLPPLQSTRLFGLDVASVPMQQAVDWLCMRLERGDRTHVAFLNAHCVNVAAAQADYRAVLEAADVILPDGSGLALAARLCGVRLAANLNGTDLVPQLCARLAAAGHSVFLVGGKPGIAEAVADQLRRCYPKLRIVGTQHGYFPPDDEARVITEINASGANVVLAAMGVPLQETWLHRVGPRLAATMRIGIGGCFDFLSGSIPRAPVAMRRLGCEWVYRLYQEPLRMWQRYILGNPAFVVRATLHALPDGPAALRQADLALKRMIDFCSAAVGLLFAAPLFLIVAMLIRATSPGPALLRQTRIGQDGKPFSLFKFRSMYVDADARRAALEQQNQHGADGVTFKLRRDPRVTPVGRLLRRSSIDELPQLWNVLIGDMSLVGPRPPLPAEVARYRPAQRRRLEAKPGLTCLWQVGGRANLPFERQVDLDIEYLLRRNTLMDLVILLRTVPAVLTARGAY
jgi:exopolysaccharide biosynthesis WecB/TagA/CpsF family protein